MLRGGSWSFSAEICRSAFRGDGHPSYRDIFIGFRVVLAPRLGATGSGE
ncbi:MAG: SUMF1/EgtB/PvdO family nonheme iron enzyme [Limisphaerales bacterium]